MFLLLDIPPGPARGDGSLLIVVVAVAFAFLFIAALAAVGIFYFVRRRKAVGSSRVDLQACKLEYSIVSPK